MMRDCPSPEGSSIATGATAQAYAPARNHAEAIRLVLYTALHSNNASDNTNVLIALHPFGIGIALARHQQLQDTIHILW